MSACIKKCSSFAILMVVALAVVAIVASDATVAHAENPLYCNGYYMYNSGCNGSWGNYVVNEARNQNGGCITVQWGYEGGGYSGTVEACGGEVAKYEFGGRSHAYPRCWNRSNSGGGYSEIHCRVG